MPDVIPRQFRGEYREWIVYTRDEADEKEICYKPWRESLKEDWAISDDDYVAQVVRVNGPYYDAAGRERRELVLPYCRVWTSKTELFYEEYRRGGFYAYHKPQSPTAREARSGRGQRVIKTYAKLMVEYGGSLPEPVMRKLARLYRPGTQNPMASVKRFLRTKEAKKVVAEELARLLSESDITPKDVLENYKRIGAKAEQIGQLNVAKGIQDRFADMLDMKPDKKEAKFEAGVEVDWARLMQEEEAAAELGSAEHLLEESLEESLEEPLGEEDDA